MPALWKRPAHSIEHIALLQHLFRSRWQTEHQIGCTNTHPASLREVRERLQGKVGWYSSSYYHYHPSSSGSEHTLPHTIAAIEDLNGWLDPLHANNLAPGLEACLEGHHTRLWQRDLDGFQYLLRRRAML